ncbi:MAG: glycoside hydrolase [Bryobacterales bacterium]|nr:glycoside hydrolase [Bryobacterales bacterium]
MPRIHLCFVWHMHQPFYKDLISGEYRLPWTRMHALKDYYGMVRVLEEFPSLRQTFNLVPSLVVQLEEYAAGTARDPFLNVAVKPAEELTGSEADFLLANAFHADPARLIRRYPRYGELFDLWQSTGQNLERARRVFPPQALRDLQILSQVAWFDEEFLARDAEVAALVRKGRDYSLEDQRVMERKQHEILSLVLPACLRLARSGQIEISTTPFYHPILPLLCDSDIAAVSRPGVPLPRRFRYPQDARRQLEMARGFISARFGIAPAGMWPSEGSVSDETLRIAADTGFEWAATDSAVLDRTLGNGTGVEDLYRLYEWRQDGRRLKLIFRDHLLSDLIGFVYSRMGAAEAAEDFLGRIRANCRGVLSSGRDALVPIILDGENAWEYYEQNGRPFLRELYRRISEDPDIAAITVREALSKFQPRPLDHIFPASWIDSSFSVWIGSEEDNRAWEYLLRARETYDRMHTVPPERRQLAFEELLVAEGSDWCWWYGPEHHSASRPQFDQLYRDHLANVYRALGVAAPEELSRPILKTAVHEIRRPPTDRIRPVIDGEVGSYFEWLGAGYYKADSRSGAMHGRRLVVRELHYGSDGANLYLLIEFKPAAAAELPDLEVRVRTALCAPAGGETSTTIRFTREGVHAQGAECAWRKVLEARIPAPCDAPRFQISVWSGGLPLDALPQDGWLEVQPGLLHP